MNEQKLSWWWIAAVEAAIVAVIVAGVGLLVVGADGADANHAMAAPTAVTVDLATVPADIADNYHYADEHRDAFAQIPCYCGCDKMLGHRNLTDCYITATGAWDAHASGCAVCSQETVAAREQLDAGVTPAETAAAIIQQYGPPPSLFGQ